MKPSTSVASFQDFLAQRRLAQGDLTVPQLVESTLSFYQSVRASGLAKDDQSDMLLFQWGVFDWGHGEHFEFDITRQFISAGAFGDDAISQLRCTAYFAPTSELRAIPIANRWCSSVAEVGSFSTFIRGSAAYRAVSSLKPSQVSLRWGKI
jgi:putative lipase involved disintegration of autophagic bodies